jgi:predicted permease
LTSRLEQIPTVKSATFFANLGQLSGNVHQSQCLIDGYVHRAEDEVSCVLMNVGSGFFETMGTSLVLGKGFHSSDVPARSDVVVINETMAKQYFGVQNPLGRRIGGKEIIGVAKDAKYYTLREPAQRTMYTPILSGFLFPDVRFAVRTSRRSEDLAGAIRQIVQEVTPQFQLTRIETMNEVAEATLVQDRFLVQLAGFFSLLGLVLVCIGLYGTISYAVTQRTGEVGIRMALGARVSDVIRLFMWQTFRIIAIGMALGFMCTLAAARIVSGLLFGLTATDPMTIATATAFLAIFASLAAYLPARRAAHVEPAITLRHE